MRDLTLQESRDYTYEGRCRLWGGRMFCRVGSAGGRGQGRALEGALPAVEQRLEWLENNRAGVESLCWMTAADLARTGASVRRNCEEEDAECYHGDDGQKGPFSPSRRRRSAPACGRVASSLNGKEGERPGPGWS